MSRTNFYQRPSVPPTTAWARHLDAIGREKGLSQSGLAEWLHDAVGLGPKSRTAFRPYLQDKEPNADQAKALAAIVGWPKAEPAARTDPLLGKPADLATALRDLTLELAAWRTERAAWERGVLAALAATEGLARSALLDALVPRPLEAAQP